MGNSSKQGMSVCESTQKGLFLSVYFDDIKLAAKKENMDPK